MSANFELHLAPSAIHSLAEQPTHTWHSLSRAQRGLWLAYTLHPEDKGDFNLALTMRTRPAIEPHRLARALESLMVRHPMLRARFAEIDGEPVQTIVEEAIAPLSVTGVESLDDGQVSARVKADRVRPLAVASAPPFRATLYVAARESVLCVVFDHLVSDGWSLFQLTEELGELLESEASEVASTCVSRPPAFFEYVARERDWLFGKRAQKQFEYWRELVAKAEPALELRPDHRRTGGRPGRESRAGFELVVPADLSEALRVFAANQGTTLFVTLFAAYAALLHRVSGQERVSIGSAMPTRGGTRQRTVGNLVNRVVMPSELEPGMTVDEFLKQLGAVSVRTLKNKDFPFEELSERLRPERSGQVSYHRAFYVFQKARHAHDMTSVVANCKSVPPVQWGGLEVAAFGEHLPSGALGQDLTLETLDLGDVICTSWGYDTSTFDRPTIERFAKAWLVMLRSIIVDPSQYVARLPWLTTEDHEQIVCEWNQTAAHFPREQCMHELFEAHAEHTPGALALQCGDEALTYAELNERANRLAFHLRSLGVRPETRVGLLVERGIELVVGLLAIMKAGGAYVPLDPAYPASRIAYMLRDSEPAVVLARGASRRLLADLALAAPVIDMHEDAHLWAHAPRANPSARDMRLTPRNLAYVIYTSGSTGVPKGVMNEHRGLCNLVAAQAELFEVTPASRVLQFASPSFDASVSEIGMALTRGASLHLAARAELMPGRPLMQTLARHAITHVTLPPTAVSLCDAAELPSTVTTMIVAGEAVSATEARRWASRLTLFNAYGPTETAVCATAHRCLPGTDRVPIGRPIANARVYVLDASRAPVPIGVAGEIYIGGVPVGRGYLNRPDLTAERFLDDPFIARDAVGGANKMYKTGDLGRWLPDGNLEYLGRSDSQVKLRGYRIELSEIEACLSSADGVSEAVVQLREDTPGDKRLVAYYAGAASSTVEVLRERAATSLPEYMVPAAYVRLESFPLTLNGKVDRKALPAPERTAYLSREYEAPRGEAERTIARIWSELLDRERVGRRDNFFELGGNSLLALSFLDRARRAGVHAEIKALFASSNLAEFASRISSDEAESNVPPNLIPDSASRITPSLLPLVRLSQAEIDRIVARVPGGASNVQDIYPLAPLQEGMLFHHLVQPHGDTYVIPIVRSFESRGLLDAYVRALSQVIDRHDVLRTSVEWEGLNEPVQVVQRRAPLSVETLQLAGGAAAIDQLKASFDPRCYRMDLRCAPLLRAYAAYEVDARRWLLVVAMHHLAGDQATLQLLFEEARAIEAGRSSELLQPVPFRNFVARTRTAMSRQEHDQFFAKLLGDVSEPTAAFGLVDVRGAAAVERAQQSLSREVAARVRVGARKLGVSAASLMHVAWSLVLARASGRTDVVFGTVLFGRMHAGAQADRALGLFINTLPVRVRLAERSVAQSLQEVQSMLAELLEHEHASLVHAQRCSGIAAQTPLFSALFNYRHVAPELTNDGAQLLWGEGSTNYPLALSVDDSGVDFVLSAQAPHDVGAERVCSMMSSAVERLLVAVERAPSSLVCELDVLPESERVRVLAASVGHAPNLDGRFFHEQFEFHVACTPDAVALVLDGACLTYRELNERANQLAHHVRALGVGPDKLVAICLQRGFDLVIAIIAIWKAGGAYVPLDPAYPVERLEHMLRDSEPVLLLSDEIGGAALSGLLAVPKLDLQQDSAAWAHASKANIDPSLIGLRAEHLAYVIYTSGSTGKPKGVMNVHRGLSNLSTAQAQAFDVERSSRVLQFASPSFDGSVAELALALGQGATLCLAKPSDLLPGQPLVETLMRLGITFLALPPSALPNCDDVGLPFTATTLVVVGEALSGSAASKWASRLALFNGYGPTETTVCATAHRCEPSVGVVPIGRPVANVRTYILDLHQKPVPIGVIGEIVIGGAGVSRGYLNRPELTAQRFLPDPFAPDPIARMYRSGDLGRWLPDGTIEYLGRRDQQVKLRGFRIELGEIETRLASLHGVSEVAVVARQDAPGEQRLVAYYCGPTAPAPSAMRAHAVSGLPEFMVPSAYVRLDVLPLTPSGKLDRARLPVPDDDAYVSRSYEPPSSALEHRLAALWAEVLRRERIGRNDNFFELGGHSLSAIQVMTRVQRELQVEIALRDLFTQPTLAEFAIAVAEARGSDKERAKTSNLVTLRKTGKQVPLFGVHALGGTVDYLRRLVKRLDPDQPVYGLEASGWNAGEESSTSLSAMASRYVAAIKTVQPKGPYRLLGYSAGGVIAYAMSEALIARGETVEFLGIVDTRADLGVVPEVLEAVERSDRAEREYGPDLADAIFLRYTLQDEIPAQVKHDFDRALEAGDLSAIFAVMNQHRMNHANLAAADLTTVQRAVRVMRSTQKALCHYRPRSLPVSVTLFLASSNPKNLDLSSGWREVAARVRAVPIGGTHLSIVETPHLETLAHALMKALGTHVASQAIHP
jgi:amino acid adenylation domain-containing protein